MITSSTHDTKRSEDVRARISVISEKPAEWRAALNRWSRLNRKLKTKAEGILAPHRVDEYVIYQTLIGTWPWSGLEAAPDTYVERMQEYIIKVAREASRFTNWVNPDEAYEGALRNFVFGMLDPKRSGPFIADFTGYIEARLDAGLINGLAQQILKLTSPGVPDIYQGTEFWDDSLVDPDNRRPVDFDARTGALVALDGTSLQELVAERCDGRIKLMATTRLLNFRREYKRLFSEGDYAPVQIEGPAADHVLAFTRSHQGMTLLVAVPRLLTKLAGAGNVLDPSIWEGTTMADPGSGAGSWRDLLSGDEVTANGLALTELFATIPLRVLVHGEKDYSG
jgi:(1->4)-alpha-D-glucan 1-alpha-D-glucosylmutase